MVDGQNFFDQPIKSNLRTHDNNPKIVTYQEGEIRNWLFPGLFLFQKLL